MRIATAHIQSTSAYSQSRAYQFDKLEGETNDMAEERTWREKCHTTPDGHVFIPPMAFVWALQYAAKRMGRCIPGKGKKTYTKTFENGVLCVDPVVLSITKDQVRRERVHVNADGVRGSGKRVFKNFPMIDEWKGRVIFHVMSDEIPNALFEETLAYAGAFSGIGRFRPEKGGYLGRFEVKKIDWD